MVYLYIINDQPGYWLVKSCSLYIRLMFDTVLVTITCTQKHGQLLTFVLQTWVKGIHKNFINETFYIQWEKKARSHWELNSGHWLSVLTTELWLPSQFQASQSPLCISHRWYCHAAVSYLTNQLMHVPSEPCQGSRRNTKTSNKLVCEPYQSIRPNLICNESHEV